MRYINPRFTYLLLLQRLSPVPSLSPISRLFPFPYLPSLPFPLSFPSPLFPGGLMCELPVVKGSCDTTQKYGTFWQQICDSPIPTFVNSISVSAEGGHVGLSPLNMPMHTHHFMAIRLTWVSWLSPLLHGSHSVFVHNI